jgi:bacteriochlorophyllide a dehydrogenase
MSMARPQLETTAVVLERPEHLALRQMALPTPEDNEIVVDIEHSGISTGTERLLWSGKMPMFPGMGYPLVPGYESVGRVREASKTANVKVGDRIFVPGAKCYGDIKGLFGGAASRIVVAENRVWKIDSALGEQGALLALAATAYHAIAAPGGTLPDLIVGHGVLGRLIARIAIALGRSDTPVVWESNLERTHGATGYVVLDADTDRRRDYRAICDVSGDAKLLNALIARLAPGGEITLAGFYSEPLSFAFPPAFMREVRIRVAAEWKPDDLIAVRDLIDDGRLSLDGLITHRVGAEDTRHAYETAFKDPHCLKMILDWKAFS